MWYRALDKLQCTLPKAQKMKSRRKSLLSKRGQSSSSGESAAVHIVQSDLTSFSDGVGESDNDPAVVRTVEVLTVVGSDVPTTKQEKETGSSGGIPSQ